MKRGRKAAIGIFGLGIALLNTGCIERIGQWALNGFGWSIGEIPIQAILGPILADFLTGLTG